MKLTLVRPTLEWKEKALDYRQEHFENDEMIINGSELLDKTDSYEDWLKSVTDNTSPDTVNPNWVVTDTFFAIDENENIIITLTDGRVIDLGNIPGASGVVFVPHIDEKGILTWSNNGGLENPEPYDLNAHDEWTTLPEEGIETEYVWEYM